MLEIVDEPLEPGRVIAGQYRLERPLGEGGMGVVWAAREIASGRGVALKLLRADREDEAKSRARFTREARAAMAVSHPNVARVYAVGETDTGTPFLVMDLLEGESLRSLLRRRRPLPMQECARIFVSIAGAVEAAHALGIVHRDLKPENVFLVGGRDVRVLDFGIAKQLPRGGDETQSASLTSTGALVGTPYYMAPEQVFGDGDLDGRADVWAIGIMLYECLSGSRPIEGAGLGPILRRITIDPIRPLRDAFPFVPLEVASLVDRMLSRAREQRPSLAEVRHVLARAAANVAPMADVPTRIDPGPTAARRPVPTPQAPVHLPMPTQVSTTAGVVSKRSTQDTPPPHPTTTSSGGSSKLVVGIVSVLTIGAVAAAGVAGTTRLLRSAETRAPSEPSSMPPTPPGASSSEAPPAASGSASLASAPESAPLAGRSSGTAPGPPAAPAAPTPAGADGLTATQHGIRARAAFDKRDGATCLREYAEYDRKASDERLPPSTDPASGAAPTRAMCMMLAGECDRGKDLHRRHREQLGGASAAALDVATDRVAAEMCTGNVSPRDQLRRADARLSSAASGARRASAKECLEWYDAVSRLSSTVPPRSSEDDLPMMRPRLVRTAPSCLARSGDCAGSYRVFRDELLRTRPGPPSEQDIRGEYAALTSQLRLCEGTP